MVTLSTRWEFIYKLHLETHIWHLKRNSIDQAKSEVRVCVEWMFGNVTNYYKFVDFKKQLKIGLSPVRKIRLVCGIPQNVHTCIYGNIVSEYFN